MAAKKHELTTCKLMLDPENQPPQLTIEEAWPKCRHEIELAESLSAAGIDQDAAVMQWIADICERNGTHVDSIHKDEFTLDVTLGDLRELVLSYSGVLMKYAEDVVRQKKMASAH